MNIKTQNTEFVKTGSRKLPETPVKAQDFDSSANQYSIKVVSQLNLAALQLKEDKQLFLLYCLRSIDHDGRGVLKQSEAVDILVDSFGYKRTTIYKHLQLGNGTYWKVYLTRAGEYIIILAGIKKVTRHLNVNLSKNARWTPVSADKLPTSRQLQYRRAILYNIGAYKPIRTMRKTRPISRKSLEEKTGINIRQQKRYDANIDHNSQGGMGKIKTIPYARQKGTYKLIHQPRLVLTGDFDHYFVVHQLPNRYWTWHDYGTRGMLYKVARECKAKNQSLIIGMEANVEGLHERRYYNSFKSFYNAYLEDNISTYDCYYPCKSNDYRMILGEVW